MEKLYNSTGIFYLEWELFVDFVEQNKREPTREEWKLYNDFVEQRKTGYTRQTCRKSSNRQSSDILKLYVVHMDGNFKVANCTLSINYGQR